MNLFPEIDLPKDRLRNNLSGYEKTGCLKTYERCAMLSQRCDLAEEPNNVAL